MKVNTRVNKNDNTTIAEYYKVKSPFEFRYKMLSKILTTQDEAIMFIDTNSKTKVPEKRIEAYFDENDVEYSMFKINQREKKIFGMIVNAFRKPTPKLTEKYIIAKVNKEMFTKQFFDDYVSTYDLALGFGSKLSIDQMVKDYREKVDELFFDKEFFNEFVYDSIIFASMRTTMDIKDLAAECE